MAIKRRAPEYPTDKSYVALCVGICPICGAETDEGVLMDTRLRDSLPRKVYTRNHICEAHQAKILEGYSYVLEFSDYENGKQTGHVAELQPGIWEHVFDVPRPGGGVCAVAPDTFAILRSKLGS